MNKKYIFVNFKTNKNSSELKEYFNNFKKYHSLDFVVQNFNLVFFVNHLYLMYVKNIANPINIGSQDGFYMDSGNYTGNVSIAQISNEDINWILLGHYEQYKYNFASSQIVNQKLLRALSLNMNCILCFGESNKDDKIDILKKQLNELLTNVNFNLHKNKIILAYEPVYAIGGKSIIDINSIDRLINELKIYLFQEYQVNIPIVYGGSVNNTNINQIFNSTNIDGVLIGSAAWNVNNFISMLDLVKEIKINE